MAATVNVFPVPAGPLSVTVSSATGISGDGSSGTPLAGVAASAAAVGYESIANFNKLATLPTAASFLVGAGKTGTIDFLAAVATTYTIDLPLMSGMFFIPLVCQVVFDTITGTAAGNVTISVGNANGPSAAALANVIVGSNIAAAAINVGAGNTPYRVSLSVSNTGPIADMTSTQLSVRIGANPTGATVLNGRLFLSGIYT